jgi:hypothetical protein
VTGYVIRATDGDIGHVDDVLSYLHDHTNPVPLERRSRPR